MCTDGKGNVSANQSAFNAQPDVHHSLQMSPTSLNEGAELQGEERIQSWDGTDGITTTLWVGIAVLFPARTISVISIKFRGALGPIHLPVPWALWDLSLGIKKGQNANNTQKTFLRKRVRTRLSIDERNFLLAVQRGDIRTTKRLIDSGSVDKDCIDPMGRTALVLAIINEDLPMVTLLISLGVQAQDALLHAISEEFVEAVELLLDHEAAVTAEGQQYSWESLPSESRSFSCDITPLILAAHLDHFEIIRMLLERGATLPVPHVRCGCCECITSCVRDSVHHSRSRMNAYRALASPSLICLTAKDPILSAFQLSWELRRLSFEEHEFRRFEEEMEGLRYSFARPHPELT
ncbi:transient receptor potential-gamma protein isoform X2 [Cryptotermes secundus]|uniref:transient receptor potential-gamma protein isoform X2 n=1 Tax=Cryptotermes secundus TaxID=105785 RepID=UPI001454C260|nr:transient receptor potential-gamma protein isoform X2 [Cryptotermes secundus]